MKMPPLLALIAIVSACSVPAAVESASGQEVQTVRPVEAPVIEPTRIDSPADALRLRQNSGVTLQWIGWDERGSATVTQDANGVYRLIAQQTGDAGARLIVGGTITEIGEGYFVLDGTIAINNAPDAGRACLDNRKWRFEVTQNRQYYRMRKFEWCDGLTDYIDIYF